MIPFDYITEWRAQAPWTADAHVEQDLILSRAVVQSFQRYLEHEGKRVTRAELEMNLHEKFVDRTFASDVEPLIAPGIDWSVERAADFVQRELLPLLPGEPWRGGV